MISVPEPVIRLDADKDTTEMTVKWESPIQGKADGYEVVLYESDCITVKHSMAILPKTDITKPFDALQPGVTYCAQVASYSGTGVHSTRSLQRAKFTTGS